MDTSIIEIKNDVVALVTQVADAKELNSLIKDTSDLIGTVSTTYEMMKHIYLFYERKKFEAFIIELYKKFHSRELEEGFDSKKLNEYFSNPINIEHMSQIIDSSLHSQAIKCSAILGSYAGGILLNQKKIEYRDKVVLNALKVMNDNDLINFIKLYQFVKSHPSLRVDHLREEFRTIELQKEIESLHIEHFELELTIEKLKGVQAIGYGVGGFGNVGNAWGVFILNINSDYLYEIVVKFVDLLQSS